MRLHEASASAEDDDTPLGTVWRAVVGAVDAVLATAHARPGSEMRLEPEGMAGESSRHPSVMCIDE